MVLAVAPGALGPVGRRLRPAGPWLAAVALVLQVWEVFTAKLGMLLTPFFAPPKSLVEVHVTDWARLLGGHCAWWAWKALPRPFLTSSRAGWRSAWSCSPTGLRASSRCW